jgi:hypothetical protein
MKCTLSHFYFICSTENKKAIYIPIQLLLNLLLKGGMSSEKEVYHGTLECLRYVFQRNVFNYCNSTTRYTMFHHAHCLTMFYGFIWTSHTIHTKCFNLNIIFKQMAICVAYCVFWKSDCLLDWYMLHNCFAWAKKVSLIPFFWVKHPYYELEKNDCVKQLYCHWNHGCYFAWTYLIMWYTYTNVTGQSNAWINDTHLPKVYFDGQVLYWPFQ